MLILSTKPMHLLKPVHTQAIPKKDKPCYSLKPKLSKTLQEYWWKPVHAQLNLKSNLHTQSSNTTAFNYCSAFYKKIYHTKTLTSFISKCKMPWEGKFTSTCF